ncbi:histamine H3 receptor-like [Spea bombifrons]|uniref:histamine H3 receptor-like n=1 Tax=Spea bombifrons TaxID=233779 RepID=UPI00234C0267|nr:histamine H3 receptor-like [Spea bombifrons]
MFPHPVHIRMRSLFLLSGNMTNLSDGNSSLVTGEISILLSQNIMILLIVLISFFILVTVLGNTLVILAFIEDKRLRNQSNFFLLNLAICDFFIGAFCIPLYVPYVFTGKWLLGNVVCKLWLVVDNLMCTASALNVALISYDRFVSVAMAVMHRSQQNNHGQTVLKMAAVWILSSLVYSPAILFWDYLDDDKPIPDFLCVPGYYYSWYFLLGASTFDFFLPLTSISFFNLRIYWNIKMRSRKKRQVMISSASSNEHEPPAGPFVIASNILNNGRSECKSSTVKMVKKRLLPLLFMQCFKTNVKDSSLYQAQAARSNIRIVKLSHDKKIAKSLSVLVCVFCICWAPYSLLMVIRAACRDYCLDSYWYDITFWLLWLNSSINPLLYPLCHTSFRKAFLKVISKCMLTT